MGLYDRDWFWEDADRRYSDSPTSKKKNKPHQQSNTLKNEPQKIHFSEKDYDIKQMVCKHCLKITNVAFPKRKSKIDLGRSYICPNCNKVNYIDRWKEIVFLMSISIGFVLFYRCRQKELNYEWISYRKCLCSRRKDGRWKEKNIKLVRSIFII